MIDYIQLMSGQRRSNQDNRAQELSEISRGLKSLAKELGVPVIALRSSIVQWTAVPISVR